MKKLLLFLIMLISLSVFVSSPVHAQSVVKKSGGRTMTNADTLTVTLDALPDGYDFIVQPVFTKATGTTAGKVYMKSSVDGASYVTIDSLTLTSTVNTKQFTLPTIAPQAYQFQFITSGTVTGTAAVWLQKRKKGLQ